VERVAAAVRQAEWVAAEWLALEEALRVCREAMIFVIRDLQVPKLSVFARRD
jgi:hypothetical protein